MKATKLKTFIEFICEILPIVGILYLPFISYLLIIYLANDELGEYILDAIISVIDLFIIMFSIFLFYLASKKNLGFLIVTVLMLLVEFLDLILVLYIYFFEGPDVRYTATESIYEDEMFAHDEAKAYFYLILILITQFLKSFILYREISLYFKRKRESRVSKD